MKMKPIAINLMVILCLFAVYSFGQANQRPVVKNCCCEHTQQIAEDLRWIRTQLSKPYKAPPDIEFNDPGMPDMPEFKVPNIKPAKRR